MLEVQSYSGSTPINVRAGAMRDSRSLASVLAHGRYADAVARGNVFIGANPFGTAVTTQAGLSATTPAATLYNPVGSGVKLSLLAVQVNPTAAPAAASDLCLAYNLKNATAPAATTDGTMIGTQIGSTAVPKGRFYRIATLAAAPVAFWLLGGVIATGGTDTHHIMEDIGGLFEVEEGVAISLQARTAIAVVTAWAWEELVK